jgi:hypothetical protein
MTSPNAMHCRLGKRQRYTELEYRQGIEKQLYIDCNLFACEQSAKASPRPDIIFTGAVCNSERRITAFCCLPGEILDFNVMNDCSFTIRSAVQSRNGIGKEIAEKFCGLLVRQFVLRCGPVVCSHGPFTSPIHTV